MENVIFVIETRTCLNQVKRAFTWSFEPGLKLTDSRLPGTPPVHGLLCLVNVHLDLRAQPADATDALDLAP
jgi:hypothetical protein